MPDLDYYLKLIPSQHSDKPKFVATVKARIEFYVRLQAFLQSMTAEFDIDGSVGVQLDQNGLIRFLRGWKRIYPLPSPPAQGFSRGRPFHPAAIGSGPA